jgi:hypothetical protein
MHRVRVGALGLACVFLFVMLAAAFLHAAGDSSVANGNAAAVANDQTPSEPLALLGAAPGTPAPSESPGRPVGSGSNGVGR